MQPKDEEEFVEMLWTLANYNHVLLRCAIGGAGTERGQKRTYL